MVTVIDRLIEGLKSENRDIRLISARSLGHVKEEKVFYTLMDALEIEQEAEVREQIGRSIEEFTKKKFPF